MIQSIDIFNDLNLNTIYGNYGKAQSCNVVSINSNSKVGLAREDIQSQQYNQDVAYQDIICSGFLRKDLLQNYV